MQKINYGLIVSDFDGTLVLDDGTIPQNTKVAIERYINDGGRFAISTGRLPAGILPRAKELGLRGAVSCCQGAVIVDIESEEILFSGFIPNAIAVEICKKIESLDLHVHVYDVWDFYCNKDDEALALYMNITKTQAKLVTDRPMWQFLQEKGFDVCKFLIMVEPERREAVRQELEKEPFAGCCITKSADFLLEFVSEKYSKGTAIDFLANYYGVPVEKTVGVGDQWNDIPMLEKAGLGIAVKNADEKLKAKADVVLEYSNADGAIEEIIKKYGYRTIYE